MKNFGLIFLFSIVTISAFGQVGSYSLSVMRSRVNDSTAAIAANVAPIAAGYAPIYWNNQATVPGWRVWNGTSYDIGFSAGGGGGVTTMAAIGATPNANGATISGSTLNLQPASDSFGGVVTTGTQTFGGAKTFNNNVAITRATAGGTVLDIINTTAAASSYSGIQIGAGANTAYLFNFSESTTPSGVFLSDQFSIQTLRSGGQIFSAYQGPIYFATGDAGGGNSTPALKIDTDGSFDLAFTNSGTSGQVFTSAGTAAPPTWTSPNTNTSSALTDGAAITITGPKHTLTSTQATVTWTLSQTQDYQTTDIILNATGSTYTFPAGALCKVEGVASGNNTATLSGVSGDHYIMSIYKDGTNYRVAIANFGQ